ncbi:autotransporter domain-containing protein [Pseudomonas sp. MM211]|uniref:autotransporter outer membrane beta-barrel domain-containing protein n=1 Tax=Pseudomonas sp. MM211 TaxID=2866808 RepID=UPI001CECC725|nr:autotransporter domain-containing protein [Pseudomonas sp. MM211]UCJ18384.1 autotransporter domain-containing protein [Pseudomonas sp. MM211]
MNSANGQNGSAGQNTQTGYGAGGGGAGGAGVFLNGDGLSVNLAPSSHLQGGNGGNGGEAILAAGGGGGGGAGIQGTGNRTYIQIGTAAQVTGGNGGNGGNSLNNDPTSGGGGGGGGGSGVNLQGNANTLEVLGQIRGGNGSTGGSAPDSTRNGIGGMGAAGVRLQGNDNRLIVTGLISGGLSATDGRYAESVRLLGNNNRLELHAGYSFQGNVASTGTGNALVLGGTSQASFDLGSIGTQLLNFTSFEKTGSSTWTLTGTNHNSRNWSVLGGTLIGSTNSFGNGNLSTTAHLVFDQSQAGTYSGSISGTGNLSKAGAGTLTLLGNHTYTGMTTIAQGTLQVGSGGSGSSLNGNVVNHATLVFNHSNSAQLNGTQSGTGQLIKSGTGTLILTGINNHTGGTQISTGNLQIGNGGTTGSITGNISNNAALSFNRSDTLTYAGNITGTGRVNQAGSGTLIITGDNQHTGGTQISAGTLQIGNSGTTGSISGTILNNATLNFDRSDDIIYLDTISGTGQVVQTGSSNLTLGNGNSYQGGTRIVSGSLTGDIGSFGSGAIVNDATLIIDQQFDGILNNRLSGSGALRKTGTGKLIIETNSSAGSGTLIESGSLIVGGSAGSVATLSSVLISAADTRLGGHGRIIGDVQMLNGSTLAPGNSIGTLTVDGNLSFAAGSTFEIEVDPSGTSDRLISTQTVDLGGTTLQVLANLGDWSAATTYTIISAGRVDGTFAAVSSNLAFLTTSLDYSLANEVHLTLLRNDVRFDSVAHTYNQRATADAVESAGVEQRVYRAVSVLDPDGARLAFDSLSGELHASLQSALLDDSRYLRDGINARLLAAQHLLAGSGRLNSGDGVNLWLQGYGGQAQNEDDGNASNLNRDSNGTLLGGDLALGDNWQVGAAVGLGKTDIKDGRDASADIDSRSLAVYASAEWNAIKLRTGAARSWHDVSTRRKVKAGTFSEQTHVSYAANTTQAFAELGYRLQFADYQVEPFIGLAHAQVERDGFRERGGDSALQARREKHDLSYSTLGVNGVLPLGRLGNTPVSLQGSLGWQRALRDASADSRHGLASGEIFRVRGTPTERNSATARLGLSAQLTAKVNVTLDYSGRVGESVTDNSLRLGVSIGF